MNKQKAAKVILIISFVPYGLVLLSGILGAVFGVGLFSSTYYGWDGFLLGAMAAGLTMLYIPIIPACLIYQIVYFIRSRISFFKNLPLKKFAAAAGIIAAVILGAILVNGFSFEIESAFQKHNAKKMLENADESIEYHTNEHYMDGIFGFKDCIHDRVLVDYDKHEVGLLYNAGYDEYWSVLLAEISADSEEIKRIERSYVLQADIPLDSPGKTLRTFSENPSATHRTIAMILEMSDGSVYYADELRESDTGYVCYSGLDSLEFRVGTE